MKNLCKTPTVSCLEKIKNNAAMILFQKQNFKTFKTFRAFVKFTCIRLRPCLGSPASCKKIGLVEAM